MVAGYPLQLAPRWHQAHCSCLKEANLSCVWLSPADGTKRTPLTKAEIKQAWSRGHLQPGSLFWAPGMQDAAALWHIRELRWLVSAGAGGSWKLGAAFAEGPWHICKPLVAAV